MKRSFAAATSEHPLATQAVGEVVGAVLDEVGPEPDVVMMFVTAAHTGVIEDMADAVRTLLSPGLMVAVTAESVIGGGREIERSAAVTLWAGRFGAEPVRLRAPGAMSVDGFDGVDDLPERGTLVLVADPYTFPVEGLLADLASTRPELVVIGGLASGARARGGNRLVLDGDVHRDGAVGFVVDAAEPVHSIVSQGCRPVGEPLIVTRAEHRVVHELAGRPALDRLEELIACADVHERHLLANGLHAGIVIDERKIDFGPGDFLIRNVHGGNRTTGAVAVDAEVPVGATLQFQVRDAESAHVELQRLLAGRLAEAALVFTCNGRGTQLFERPDHDAQTIHELTGGPATGGMFCAGEFGPVGRHNHLHTLTASVLLFGVDTAAQLEP